ncbi:MAG: hypothetical protein R3C15_22230 [Thermoleophilia bacterium]
MRRALAALAITTLTSIAATGGAHAATGGPAEIVAIYANPGHLPLGVDRDAEIPFLQDDRTAIRVVVRNTGQDVAIRVRVGLTIVGPRFRISARKLVYRLRPGGNAERADLTSAARLGVMTQSAVHTAAAPRPDSPPQTRARRP